MFRVMGTSAEPLDTTIRLMTPERIILEYPLAGPFRRAGAYLIDMVVYSLILALVGFALFMLSLGSESSMGLILLVSFVLFYGYGAFCEVVFNGRTPGKGAMGLRVVSETGVPIVPAQALLRNLIGLADGWPLGFVPGLTSMLLTRRFQRLGDLAAGTMVIVERAHLLGRVARVDGAPEVQALLPYLPTHLTVGSELARALSDYVRRRDRFGRLQKQELADPLARPLRTRYGLPPNSDPDAVLCAVYHRVFVGE